MENDGSGELAYRMPYLRRACSGWSVVADVYPTIGHETDLQVFLSYPGQLQDRVWACILSPETSESEDVVTYDPNAEDLDAALTAAIAGWITRNITGSPSVEVHWAAQEARQKGTV